MESWEAKGLKDRLVELNELRDQGVISEENRAEAVRRVLDEFTSATRSSEHGTLVAPQPPHHGTHKRWLAEAQDSWSFVNESNSQTPLEDRAFRQRGSSPKPEKAR
ncbi:uncharacterized protein Tco025E_08360 [Trypanosoma conorhini]|uniref:Uncharacterized protein n=1 Tax=Trypanosoma conorhini TaxID=83891 RepID=A0A422NBA1_9TRYP|nr:uncharacterized protein Tco025E_08360 [Trypanosoma conorhini]RNF02758.1 hypothetical protein Tco025E_08360 [Trypanosoma conorhini]